MTFRRVITRRSALSCSGWVVSPARTYERLGIQSTRFEDTSRLVLPFTGVSVRRRGGEMHGIISAFRRLDSDFIGELLAGGIYHRPLKRSCAPPPNVATAVRKLVRSWRQRWNCHKRKKLTTWLEMLGVKHVIVFEKANTWNIHDTSCTNGGTWKSTYYNIQLCICREMHHVSEPHVTYCFFHSNSEKLM